MSNNVFFRRNFLGKKQPYVHAKMVTDSIIGANDETEFNFESLNEVHVRKWPLEGTHEFSPMLLKRFMK